MQSVVAGQAPITLEWKKYLGSKTEAYIACRKLYWTCMIYETRNSLTEEEVAVVVNSARGLPAELPYKQTLGRTAWHHVLYDWGLPGRTSAHKISS